MKITIVTVCLNAEAWIANCLRSVATQTYSDFEHIIIDGASSDRTLEIVGAFPHITKVISERDAGLYDAMNKGIALASGDFVYFLNSDDELCSHNTLSEVVEHIKDRPNADVYYGDLEVFGGRKGKVKYCHSPDPDGVAEMMILGCLPHQSTLARRQVFNLTGPFNLQYFYHADYDWFLKVIWDPRIVMCHLPIAVGRFRPMGLSSNLEKSQPEVHIIQNRSPLYATPEWDRRRLQIYQEAYLRERVANRKRFERKSPIGLKDIPGIRLFEQVVGKRIEHQIKKLRCKSAKTP